MSNPFVFVSYSTNDGEFAQQLFQDLQAAGITVWMDKHGVKAGTPDWEQAIREAIRDAYAIVLVASPDSRDSRYVRDELLIGEMYQRKVIAIWSRGEQWPECVRMGYIGTQYADGRDGKYHNGLLETVNALRGFSSIQENKELQVSLPSKHDLKPRNPYKGLRSFTSGDRGDFFGRNKLIDELVEALKENIDSNRFLAVVGASGSGKSSVVMAGLIPRLQSGVLNQSDKWIYLEPVLPGSDPLEALAVVVANALNLTIGSVLDELDRSSRSLSLLAKQMTKGYRDRRVVLLIDQFEELFTQTTEEDIRSHFIDLLVTAATESGGNTLVLITLRADFYDRPMNYSALGEILEKRTKLVPPMSVEDLREVIERPVALPDVLLKFEDGLIGDLLFEVRGQSGALPLLQFTLDQLVEKRRSQLLSYTVYNEIGGVKGALSQYAEDTYQQLPSDRHRELARFLFLRLIELGSMEQDITRKRARQGDLLFSDSDTSTALHETLLAFNNARLLVTGVAMGIAFVEISHETLIREWQRFSTWIEQAREDIKIQSAINFDSHQWILHQKRIDDLYRGQKLIEASEWLQRNIPVAIENEFIISAIEEEARNILAQQLLSVDEEGKTRFIDNATYLLASLDHDLHFTYVGNAYYRVLGYSSKSLIGHSIYELAHPDDKDMINEKILQVTERLQSESLEFRYRHHDGYYLWLETIFSFSLDGNGNLFGLIVTAQDVSERRWMLRAMLEQEKLLVMLQKEQEFNIIRNSMEEKIKDELLVSLQLISDANKRILQLIKAGNDSTMRTQSAIIEKEILKAQSTSNKMIAIIKPELESEYLKD